jgi:WD40 repeat protein
LGTLVFSPDCTHLAGEAADGGVRVFDLRTGKETFTLPVPGRLSYPTFSPDGTRIAAPSAPGTGGDGAVRVFDPRTGKDAFILKGPAPLESLSFSPDGSFIAVAPVSSAAPGNSWEPGPVFNLILTGTVGFGVGQLRGRRQTGGSKRPAARIMR